MSTILYAEKPNNIAIIVAILASLLIHIALVFSYPSKPTPKVSLKPFSVSISTNNYTKANASTAIKTDLAETVTPQKAESINQAIVANTIVAEDGLRIADVTAIEPITVSADVVTTEGQESATDTLVSLDITDVLPLNVDEVASVTEGIAFQNLISLDAIEITAVELESVPEVSDATEQNTTDLLAGIDQEFKSAITSKLSKSLRDIKPIIEKQNLEGKLRFQFTIDRSGVLVDHRVIQSSGNLRLDNLILSMLKENAPYPSLPEAYQGKYLKFSYPINIKLK